MDHQPSTRSSSGTSSPRSEFSRNDSVFETPFTPFSPSHSAANLKAAYLLKSHAQRSGAHTTPPQLRHTIKNICCIGAGYVGKYPS